MYKKQRTTAIIITSTVLLSALVAGNTAFAADTTTVAGTAPAVGMRGMHQGPGVFGTVTALSGTTLTLASKGFGQDTTGVTYSVDAAKATVMKDGAAATLGSIAVGDMIGVEGTVSGTNVIATAIRDGIPAKGGMRGGMRGGHGMMGAAPASANMPEGNGQPIVGGSVTAISGNTLTVTNKSNVTFAIDVSTAKVAKAGAEATVAGITVGDQVIVQGTVNGNAVIASSVIDQGTRPLATTGVSGNTQTPAQHKGFFGMVGGFFGHLFGF